MVVGGGGWVVGGAVFKVRHAQICLGWAVQFMVLQVNVPIKKLYLNFFLNLVRVL